MNDQFKMTRYVCDKCGRLNTELYLGEWSGPKCCAPKMPRAMPESLFYSLIFVLLAFGVIVNALKANPTLSGSGSGAVIRSEK